MITSELVREYKKIGDNWRVKDTQFKTSVSFVQ